MPLVPYVAEPPVITSNAVIELQAPAAGSVTVATGVTLVPQGEGPDPFVEAPIEFAAGFVAPPRDRGDATPEIKGSGPFGF